jgi:glutamate dehydrogenase
MVQDTISLIRQATYWLIQRHRGDLGIESQVGRLQPGVRALAASQPGWLEGLERAACDARSAELVAAGVPVALARQVAACSALQCAPDIVELAQSRRMSVDAAASAYFGVGAAFGLDWLRSRIEALDIDGHWHAVARGSLREALYEIHRGLVQRVLDETRERDPARALERWQKKHGAAALHAQAVVADIRAQPAGADFPSLSVALQAVRRLVVAER